ncbi:NeuD/PglB/VioB family sugar acetyltransferase [Dactylosporangium roseum]|uniref:NeuD/PglB/VioB family sugar acetyltransferase n=1 Tax=Dactylosporangium roseum TaxID=47989 RepID=A0ABY5Z9S8_9ACTN|nr:NeuD/PglB/VioB family sugar acetyltransferase [Dactylosporangium roseum]UWZ37124.1 NeuD/PglB/VioB family sugar acetyltransferase [Dactylosporangium roseum]
MRSGLVIVGCGGHGRELLMIARAAGMPVRGFVDDSPSQRNLDRVAALGVPFLGATDRLTDERPSIGYAIGIGDPRVRAAVDERLRAHGMPAATLIHPAATVGSDAVIDEGFVAFAGARVTTGVRVGRHVHLNQNCTVGHDAELGDFVQVNPLAAISGDCHVGPEALIGTTACVLQGLRVGAGATVGAGACVTRDVAPKTTVKGVPAR